MMEPRAPERLVRVDVPDAGDSALVEERALDRGAAARERAGEHCGRERPVERLAADPRVEVRIELTRLEQNPDSEPSHIPIDDLRAVVQREHRAPVRLR